MKRAIVFSLELTLPEPTEDDKRADFERLRDASGLEDLTPSVGSLRALPYAIRKNHFNVSPVIGLFDKAPVLLSPSAERPHAIAMDIGTTNIVLRLYDMKTNVKRAEYQFRNPQVAFGEDILSRIQYCMKGGLKELRESLVEGINEAIKTVSLEASLSTQDVFAVVVSANTVMTHLLIGLDVRNIPVSPYIPVVSRALFFRATEIGLHINPEALVYLFPNAGSYVGGDIISGVLATG
ncbi:MAG: DUF4445 domain-containing protein, partial [Nitrospirae bacterium]